MLVRSYCRVMDFRGFPDCALQVRVADRLTVEIAKRLQGDGVLAALTTIEHHRGNHIELPLRDVEGD